MKKIKIKMKLKSVFITALAFLISANVFAQKFTISAVVNGKKIGETTVTDSPAVIYVDKIKIKKWPEVILMIRQRPLNEIYKRTLQITDGNENMLYQFDESKSKIGMYKIRLAPIRQKLLHQKIIKIFLAEDPANDMMRLPSKRSLLAELHSM